MKTQFRNLLTGGMALALALAMGRATGAPVSEGEAIALAELWYASEVSARTTDLPAAEKATRLANKTKHQVHYVLGRDNLQKNRKPGETPHAYVVTFEPTGFVVVSGEDSVQPVLAFNATGSFEWREPRRSYLSHYLGRYVPTAVERRRSRPSTGKPTPHANWQRWREQLKSSADGSAAGSGLATADSDGSGSGIYVFLPTAKWNQGDHYNEVCVAHNGGKDVATGCVATAMAIKFRYHEWPRTGNDSHSYWDKDGKVQYSHSVDFSEHAYDWSAMTTDNLAADSSEVANLMYDCGVAVDMDYESASDGGSGAFPDASGLNRFFRYKGTINQKVSSIFTSMSEVTTAVAYSIRCGLPTLIGTADHCLVACGYREPAAPYFYLNCGWGGSSDDGWYYLEYITADDPNLGPIEAAWPYSSPDNHVYVDPSSATPLGDLHYPYDSFATGLANTPSQGVLLLKAGSYSGAHTFSSALTLKSYLGSATIGQ